MRRTAIALAGAVLTLVPSLQARTNVWTPPSTSANDPDTLEIRLFLVDFKREDPDNAQTSGNGTFGSDTCAKCVLETPSLRRDPYAHALRTMRFAQDYWHKASGGRLVIRPVIEPGWKYSLEQTMSFFSLPPRATGENKVAYWQRTSVRLMELVDSVTRRADRAPEGPFAWATPDTRKKRTLFACMHAGIDRGTDGGFSGADKANTPRDLLSFQATPADFAGLRDTLLVPASLRGDSLGIPVTRGGKLDTLRSLLVLPEAMGQDGLNWGLGGTLVQQIGAALGLPFTGESGVRDPSPSVLGSWDLMDWGATSGQGFLPTLPMAWHRLYLGWSTPIELKPSGAKTRLRLPAVRPGHDTVAVVRLDGGEYLLIENRQRADSAGWSRLTQLVPGSGDSLANRLWRPDSVGTLFLDSVSIGGGKYASNARRPSGYVTSAGTDAGLPGSGLVVWKINEWLLQEFLNSGAVNPWSGDELQDHYRGITLLQASGKATLGQRFKNAAGETLLDYGTGADALPHIRRKMKDGRETRRDTVTTIPAVGYVSTQTSTGARTLISVSSVWAPSSLAEAGSLPLDGDSVLVAGDSALYLEIDWGPRRAPQDSLYPVTLPPGVGSHSVLPGPSRWPLSSWVVDSTGHVQLFDSTGAPLFARLDTVTAKVAWADSIKTLFGNAATSQSVRRFPVQNLSGLPAGSSRFPLGTAVQGDTLCVTTREGVASLIWREGDSVGTRAWSTSLATAPLGLGGFFYATDSVGNLVRLSTARLDTVAKTGRRGLRFLCRTRLSSGAEGILAVDSTGRVARIDPISGAVTLFAEGAVTPLAGETFVVASADFDRDSTADAFVLGSQGTAAMLSGKTGLLLLGWPRQFARGPVGVGVAGDPGLPAIADLEASGYPQVLFTGTDRLWLVDRSGVAPTGWPVKLGGTDMVNLSTGSRRFPAGTIGSSPLVVDLEGNGGRQVLVGSPDGRIFAFTASGSNYVGSTLTTTTGSGTKLGYDVSSWPLAAGARTNDSLQCPWLQPFATATGRLQAVSSVGGLELFRTGVARAVWGLPGGDVGRGFWLDASSLGAVRGVADLSGFHFYPHPVKGGRATVRYDLGQPARSVTLEIYDQTSFVALRRQGLPTGAGRQSYALEGIGLGTGVYAARLTVDLGAGTRTSWFRLAVVR